MQVVVGAFLVAHGLAHASTCGRAPSLLEVTAGLALLVRWPAIAG